MSVISLLLLFLPILASPLPSEASAQRKAAISEAAILRKCGALCKGKLSTAPAPRVEALLRWAKKELSHKERLHLFSRLFLATPYKYGPLGEGPQGMYDKDPIFRLDTVDCVTYIETVMALALSSSLKETEERLQSIRYKGGLIRFEERLHFTGPQWLPENQKAGYLAPLTGAIETYLRPFTKAIPPALLQGTRWEARGVASKLPPSYRLPIIPLASVKAASVHLPSIAWMGEVYDDPADPVSVAHVGFVVRDEGIVYFRHANAGRPGVRQESLASYAAWRLRQVRSKKSKVPFVGFVFSSFGASPRWGRAGGKRKKRPQ